jgi:hypothetical protein
MYKTFALILLVIISCTSARKFNMQTSPIEGVVSPFKQGNNPLDWCPECINGFDELIDGVLEVILQYGVLNTCGDLCDLVAQKTGSDFIGFLCTFGCDVLGLTEFVKLIEGADLDPIYYCEVIKACPSKISFFF